MKWLSLMEENMISDYVLDGKRVKFCANNLTGEAQSWWSAFGEENQKKLSWEKFVKEILMSFGPRNFEDPIAKVIHLKQLNSALKYCREHRELTYLIRGVPKSILLNLLIAGFREDLQCVIRDLGLTSYFEVRSMAVAWDLNPRNFMERARFLQERDHVPLPLQHHIAADCTNDVLASVIAIRTIATKIVDNSEVSPVEEEQVEEFMTVHEVKEVEEEDEAKNEVEVETAVTTIEVEDKENKEITELEVPVTSNDSASDCSYEDFLVGSLPLITSDPIHLVEEIAVVKGLSELTLDISSVFQKPLVLTMRELDNCQMDESLLFECLLIVRRNLCDNVVVLLPYDISPICQNDEPRPPPKPPPHQLHPQLELSNKINNKEFAYPFSLVNGNLQPSLNCCL